MAYYLVKQLLLPHQICIKTYSHSEYQVYDVSLSSAKAAVEETEDR